MYTEIVTHDGIMLNFIFYWNLISWTQTKHSELLFLFSQLERAHTTYLVASTKM